MIRTGFNGVVICGMLMIVATANPAGAATYTVDVGGFVFTPNDLAVTPGDTIHFVWVDGIHTATSGTPCTPDNTFFDHRIDPNNLTFDFVIPNGPAQIPYFCRFHCALFNMTGMLRIFALGDVNCDGHVDFGDINPFVLALSNPAAYAQQFPNCNINLADINGDGHVDFADINPFVALLSHDDAAP